MNFFTVNLYDKKYDLHTGFTVTDVNLGCNRDARVLNKTVRCLSVAADAQYPLPSRRRINRLRICLTVSSKTSDTHYILPNEIDL